MGYPCRYTGRWLPSRVMAYFHQEFERTDDGYVSCDGRVRVLRRGPNRWVAVKDGQESYEASFHAIRHMALQWIDPPEGET